MKNSGKTYLDHQVLRDCSTLFTRSVFKSIINHRDFSVVNSYITQFNLPVNTDTSYASLFKFIYSQMCKRHASEYVYKNEFISRLLINKFGTTHTVAFSEFHIGNSIVDLALFNGESKAFEIKTKLDSPSRLASQLRDYSSVFNKCYIIIPQDQNNLYSKLVGEEIGILNFLHTPRSVDISIVREATSNKCFDYDILMRALHTKEYENIVIKYFNKLPEVSPFLLYDTCAELIKTIPPNMLRKEFNEIVKRRKNNTSILKSVPRELRQMALAMKLSPKEVSLLTETMQTLVSI